MEDALSALLQFVFEIAGELVAELVGELASAVGEDWFQRKLLDQ